MELISDFCLYKKNKIKKKSWNLGELPCMIDYHRPPENKVFNMGVLSLKVIREFCDNTMG